ncbi:MAG: hypothetical protein KC420_08555 [Myxococcales bacterium]|nr:hypothetical protein [Myxococcales bacterium]MCB9566711.1 hypothetical protein [Myxococcales bacterium]MCB9704446.1 hypothetical protein [Myxococcales bacterium]
MSRLRLGLYAGLIFGVLDVLAMIPLEIDHKTEAMIGAFIGRFSIGFIVPNLRLDLHPALKGLLVGVVLSLQVAVIAGVWGPIVGIGGVGGAIVGLVERRSVGAER